MKKDPNTNKNLILKLQKPIVFLIFFSMIFLFVYSLIFFTPFYDFYILDASFSKSNAILYGVWREDYNQYAYAYRNEKIFGLDLHYFVSFAKEINGYGGELQKFNHLLFNFGLIGIVLSAITFLFYSQKRKIYYFTNYLFVGSSCIFGIFNAVYGFIYLTAWSNYCKNNINYNVINAYENFLNDIPKEEMFEYYSYNNFKWDFILGYVIYACVLVISVIGICYLIGRFIYQKKNPPMDLSEVRIDE